MFAVFVASPRFLTNACTHYSSIFSCWLWGFFLLDYHVGLSNDLESVWHLSQAVHALRFPEENFWLTIPGVNFSHLYVFSQLSCTVRVLKYSCSAF